jgi:DNA-binding XRE family transcriptional regulator
VNTAPVIEIRGERFALIPEAEYLNLRHLAGEDAPLDPGLLDLDDLVDADDYMAKSIGADLKAARIAGGLTQAQLAARLKKSQAMVSSAERGTIEIGARYLQAVLKACGLPEHWNPRDKAPAKAVGNKSSH